jgi:glycosyltransferase involved in cell wall biosynthesis
MRVLHCIYDDPANPWVAGGGAHRVREIYRRLADQVDVTVVSGSFPGARDEVLDGVPYRRLGARGPYAWSRATYARAATRLLHAGGYDAALFDFSVYTPIRLPRTGPVGMVVHMLHGTTAAQRFGPLLGGVVRRAELRAIRQGRWITTQSRWMVDQLRPLVPPSTRIVQVGSGVPDEFGRVERRERDYLLYYGRFDVFQKGIDVALEAFATIAAARPDVRLVLAGRGKDEARVRELAADPRLAGRVEVRAGADRAQVLELMSGALALLMPSRLEGLPLVPGEAMAAGVPVIAADVAAVPEVVAPPERGVLVPPGDAAALAAATLALLDDPARRARISAASREYGRRISWDVMARDHLRFLERIAAEDAAPSFIHTDR